MNVVYQSLYDNGIDVDILNAKSNLDNYNTVIAPLHIIYNEKMEQNLLDFIANGGHAVFDTELFVKNTYNAYFEKAPMIVKEILNKNPLSDADLAKPLTVNYKKGKVTFVGSDWSKEQWDELLIKGL